MGEIIKVNISEMSRNLADMYNLRKSAQGGMEDLVQALNALNATWEGTAHDVLINVFSMDQRNMETALNELGQYLESLVYARDEYKTCEQQVGDIVRSMQI